jgi:hypothetical protein
MSTQAVINEVRSVMFDVAILQERIAARVGGQLGPVTHERDDSDATDRRGESSGRLARGSS